MPTLTPLTWAELADWYDNHIGGEPARTIDMTIVFDRCEAAGKFVLLPDGGIAFAQQQEETAC